MADDQKVFLVKTGASLTISPPLGLMYLSSILKKNGVQVELLDLSCRPELQTKLLEQCRRTPPLGIGVSALTPDIPAATELVKQIKSINPDIPIVLGGIHASFLPLESLAEMPIDAVVIGEAEGRAMSLCEFAASSRRDYWSIPQVAAKDADGTICINRESISLTEINSLPLPDWAAIDLRYYQSKVGQLIKRGTRVATVLTSRGCPFQCRFCSIPNYYGRIYRKREPNSVVDEIEMLVTKYGVDEVQIVDDAFNVDLNHAKAVLKEIIRRNLHIWWKDPQGFYLESVDDELIDLIVRSGGYQIGFGIESSSTEILRNVNRRINAPRVLEILAKYKKAGISTFGNFVLGLPGETIATAKRTIDFAVAAPLDHIHVSLCIPYPGSALFQEMDAKGLLHHRWGEYRHFNVFPISELDANQLKRLLRKFYLRFYSRPRRAWQLIHAMTHGCGLTIARTARAYLGKKKTYLTSPYGSH